MSRFFRRAAVYFTPSCESVIFPSGCLPLFRSGGTSNKLACIWHVIARLGRTVLWGERLDLGSVDLASGVGRVELGRLFTRYVDRLDTSLSASYHLPCLVAHRISKVSHPETPCMPLTGLTKEKAFARGKTILTKSHHKGQSVPLSQHFICT